MFPSKQISRMSVFSQTLNQVHPCLSIDIEDVNKALKDIKTVLDSKTSEEDL